MTSSKPNVIFVLGGPGAGQLMSLDENLFSFYHDFHSSLGKGTQCVRISEVCRFS